MEHILPSTKRMASAIQIIALSVLDSPGHMRRYRCFAYPLTGIYARLAVICDWFHLHNAGLSPATLCQLAWRTRVAALPDLPCVPAPVPR